MKKQIISYTVSLFLSVAVVGCSDSFLDLMPESQLTDKNFYQTEEHFEQAINGAYEGLRAIESRIGFIMGEMRSDNAHYMRNELDRGQRRAEEIADFINDPVNTLTETHYRDCYSVISRTNILLDRLEGKSFSDDFKNKIIGQAKFLRAFFYFELVRFYGPVSLHLSEVSNPDNAFLPRSSVEDVYKSIVDDLKDAIAKLENPSFNTLESGGKTSKDGGRATKGSAKMLYADVLMTMPQRDYAAAEQELRDIMKMGYGFIEYAELFDAKHKNSAESIFEVQYKQGDTGQKSDYIYWMMPLTRDGVAVTGVAGSNNTSNGGWGLPTQEMVDSYEPGDKRLNVSIAVAVGEIDNQSGIMDIEDVLNIGDPAIQNYPSFCYFVNKYRNPHEKLNNTDDNFPIYRYPEVYLSLAECLIEQGRASEAVQYVNEVRRRAGLEDLTTVDAQAVANERRHEFAFEKKRWFDLVRTGKAIDVMNAYGERMKDLYPYIEERSYKVDQNKLLFPIPFRELQINSQLSQNPGY